MPHSRDPLLYPLQRLCFWFAAQVGEGSGSCVLLGRRWRRLAASSTDLQKILLFLVLIIYPLLEALGAASNTCITLGNSTISCCFLAFPPPGLGVRFLTSAMSIITYLLSGFQNFVIFPLLFLWGFGGGEGVSFLLLLLFVCFLAVSGLSCGMRDFL